MFPPLCFTDITRGEIAYEETEENMKKALTKDEYKLVNTNKANTNKANENENKIKYRFKIADTIKSIYKKIQDR
jgi:stage II sporulation protein R